MVEFKTEIHLYKGKELKAKLDDGKKIFRLLFDVGGSYPFKVDVFEGVELNKEGEKVEGALAVSELEEGEYYEVSYTIKEYTGKYGPQKGRTAYKILPSNETAWQEDRKKQKEEFLKQKDETPAPKPKEITIEKITTFFEDYKTKFPEESQSKAHFLAVFFINHYPEVCSDVEGVIQTYFDQ